MRQESLLHLPAKHNERLFKFTILTPHTFLPPNHSESLEDELAEEFAQFLCDRVSTALGERSYTPHHDGEAFLNMRFNEFEERFLRHSDYTIFITSGRNAACLDLIYPRMLVFLTIRPTWRNRGIVLYVGPPVGQKLFDQDLFANKPLIFPLHKEEWGSPENLWNTLMGTLQIRCQTKKPRSKKEQQRRYSDSAVPKREKDENVDYLCFPSRFKMRKKKRLITEPAPTQQTEQMIVKTPEVIRSSVTAQLLATLEDSLKFVDEEDPDDEIIRSEQRRTNGNESFVKPGMPPLKNQNRHEVETKQSQHFGPQIMNPDSKASSDSIEDPTLTEDYEVEFPEDLSLQSDAGHVQSCEEQKNQGSERFQDLLGMKRSHSDKQISRENHPSTLMENTDSQKVQKLENEQFRGMHLDEQIPLGRCPEKVAESTDSRAEVNTFESEDIQITKKNSWEEFPQNQEFVVDRFDANNGAQNNPKNKVEQENMETAPYNAVISPTEADDFKNSPVSSGPKSLESENNCVSKQTLLINECLQQPDIINNQLQEQSETMVEPTQPSMVVMDGVSSAVKTDGSKNELLRLDKKSSLLRKNQTSEPDEKSPQIQESIDSGLEDSTKTVEASVCLQNDLILTARTESVESASLSEESVLLPINKPFDSATNLLALDEKGNSKHQEGRLQDLYDQTPQNELITVVKADYLEGHPPTSPSEDNAALRQQPLSVSNSEDHAVPEDLRTDIDQTDAKQDISIQQNLVNCESLAPKELTLTEESDSSKISSAKSDIKRTDVCGQRRIFGREVCPKPKRRSILFDRDRSDNIFNQEACEVLREMLKDPTPETLQLVRYAVKTYDQYPSLSDSIAPTIASALESKSSTVGMKQSTYFRRIFPHISIAILNLSKMFAFKLKKIPYDLGAS
ncbi:unnamed protein product [Taenia asiatica]|uniref:UDENN domain-containing protein n=1 Tax=Taenia asiatica TaxID=60517 RepID=A0A0R3W3C9_TAEAS|nr:unnamed protein product [Taenia asiatica]